ncbi:MAG: flippase-like domain-containing protein [Elusimicrobia bacterium]|nr:flippase-like domain-containing protein [Elusimicrobiota bacterium]
MRNERLVRPLLAVLKLALAAALIGYLAKTGCLDLRGLRSMLLGGDILAVAAAAGLFLVNQALAAARLRVLLRSAGVEAGTGVCFRLTMTGFVFNTALPGAVGGDLVKAHALLKLPGERPGMAAGAVVMDRLMGALGLITLGSLSALYLVRRLADSPWAQGRGLGLAGAAAVCMAGGIVSLLLCSRSPKARAWLKERLAKALPAGAAYDAAAGLGRAGKDWGSLARAFGLSLVLQLVGVAGLLALARTAGAPLPPVADMAAVTLVVMLGGTLPLTPGNIGWTEFLAMAGWAAIGSQSGATVYLNWRVLTTLVSLPWGIAYLAGRGRAREDALAPSPTPEPPAGTGARS